MKKFLIIMVAFFGFFSAAQAEDFTIRFGPGFTFAPGFAFGDRKSTRLNASNLDLSRMPSSA